MIKKNNRKTELFKVDFSKLSMADIVDKIAQTHSSRKPETELYKTTVKLSASIDDTKNVVETLYRTRKLNKTDAVAMMKVLNRLRKLTEEVEEEVATEAESDTSVDDINLETKYPEDVDGPNVPDSSMDLPDEAPQTVDVISSEDMDDSDLDASVGAINIDLPEDNPNLSVDDITLDVGDEGDVSLDMNLDLNLESDEDEDEIVPSDDLEAAEVTSDLEDDGDFAPSDLESDEDVVPSDDVEKLESTRRKSSNKQRINESMNKLEGIYKKLTDNPLSKLTETFNKLESIYSPIKSVNTLYESITKLGKFVEEDLMDPDEVPATVDTPVDIPAAAPQTVDDIPATDMSDAEPEVSVTVDVDGNIDANVDVSIGGDGTPDVVATTNIPENMPSTIDEIQPEDIEQDQIIDEKGPACEESMQSHTTMTAGIQELQGIQGMDEDGDSDVAPTQESTRRKVSKKSLKKEEDEFTGIEDETLTDKDSDENEIGVSADDSDIDININLNIPKDGSDVDDTESFTDLEDDASIPTGSDKAVEGAKRNLNGLLPIAESVTVFNPVSASKRVLESAMNDDTSYNASILKKAFLVFEGTNAKDPNGYKFQIGDVINETLVANPIAIKQMVKLFTNTESLNALAISDECVAKVRNILEGYLNKLGEEIPWKRESADIQTTDSGRLLKIYRQYNENTDISTAINFMKKQQAK